MKEHNIFSKKKKEDKIIPRLCCTIPLILEGIQRTSFNSSLNDENDYCSQLKDLDRRSDVNFC